MAFTFKWTAEFTEWFESLTVAEKKSFAVSLFLLEEKGPLLGRPYADTLKGSAYPNMKELRATHKGDVALRAAFAFDPKRNAILLIGGDKHGKRGFYGSLIRKADELYATHLASLK
ncbi:MAG: type II toxin-antitoxin system RelE/ParE family toxin [Terriglobus sp.]